MSSSDGNLLIHNVSIFSQHRLITGFLQVQDGKIHQITPGKPDPGLLNEYLAKEAAIDGNSGLLLPGFIDTHVHLRDLEQSYKETIESGTKAALMGGVTTVFAMPNTIPPLSTPAALGKYMTIKNAIFCNVGMFAGVNTGFSIDNLSAMAGNVIFGIKIYPGSRSDQLPLEWVEHWPLKEGTEKFLTTAVNWKKLFEAAARFKLPVLIHPELPCPKETVQASYKHALDNAVKQKVRNPHLVAHEASHPIPGNELGLVELILDLLKTHYPTDKFQTKPQSAPHIHFCHLTSPEAASLINAFKKQYHLPVSIEATPHHLLLNTDSVYKQEWAAKVLTPLRSPKIQQGLFEMAKANAIDTIGTDHAPHSLEEKSANFEDAPSGFPGVDVAVRILLTQVFQDKITLDQLISYFATQPALIFGIPNKGTIEIGKDADLVLVSKTEPTPLKAAESPSKANWSPYDGLNVQARIEKVFLAGNLVFDNSSGQILPMGRFIQRVS